MVKLSKLLLLFSILLLGCAESAKNKSDNIDILKEGSELFAKYGCAVCHSLNGQLIYGPPLNEIYMKKLKVIRDGKEYEVVADREYLIKSISDPRYEKVLEYKNKEMPISNFSDEEAEILVEYLIALDKQNQAVN